MAVKRTTTTSRTTRTQKKRFLFDLPLDKQNIYIVAAGLGIIILGYIFMSQNSVDGFLPTVVAPILLVLGYCVVIPYGILKKFGAPVAENPKETRPLDTERDIEETTSTPARKPTGNIRTK